ncbi:hypothetical protein ALP12_200504 [Pseudomonas savastanoi pv. phaseolicola]|nr:hypothetical protein ALP12_200504 [Pseudomonas savastanoi pv. phaseolicola]
MIRWMMLRMMVASLQDHLAVETRVSLAQVIIAQRFSSDKRSAATGCRCNKRILLPLPWTRKCLMPRRSCRPWRSSTTRIIRSRSPFTVSVFGASSSCLAPGPGSCLRCFISGPFDAVHRNRPDCFPTGDRSGRPALLAALVRRRYQPPAGG